MADITPLHTIDGMRLRIEVGQHGGTEISWGLFELPPAMRKLLVWFPYIFYFAWGYGLWRVGSALLQSVSHGSSVASGGVFLGATMFQLVWLALWLFAGIALFKLLAVMPRLAQPNFLVLSPDVLRYEPSVEGDYMPEAAQRGEAMPRLPFRAGRPRAVARSDIRDVEVITVGGTPQLAVYTAEENFFVGLGLEEADVRRLERELRRWLAGPAA